MIGEDRGQEPRDPSVIIPKVPGGYRMDVLGTQRAEIWRAAVEGRNPGGSLLKRDFLSCSVTEHKSLTLLIHLCCSQAAFSSEPSS